MQCIINHSGFNGHIVLTVDLCALVDDFKETYNLISGIRLPASAAFFIDPGQ
jgi:hypothetical protein